MYNPTTKTLKIKMGSVVSRNPDYTMSSHACPARDVNTVAGKPNGTQVDATTMTSHMALAGVCVYKFEDGDPGSAQAEIYFER